jgi:uncharacterized protein (TIGR03083 family)
VSANQQRMADYSSGTERLFAAVTAGRLRVADVVEGLDEHQYRAPTLCAGWTAHEVTAHLLQPMLVSTVRFALVSLRYRGDVDRTVDHVTRRLAQHPRQEIVALLREHAADRVSPPMVGPWGQLAEVCLHLRDIARPLALTGPEADAPREDWVLLLGYLTSPTVAPALVPPGRLEGLRLVTTGGEETWGEGREVRGPVEALAMAATGRQAALTAIDGPGAAVLTERLHAS